jgi:hypothetical protein
MKKIVSIIIWGFVLWLIGYVLGIVLLSFVPANLLGWVIMPIGIALTLWIVRKRLPRASLRFFLLVGLLWTAIAVICDYLLLVQIFHPADGYYKLDVYLYYLLTFLLPVVFGKKVSATNSSKYTL